MAGLLMVFAYCGLLLLACLALAKFVPSSLLGRQARRVLPWLPPFVGGQALRNWAATTARQEMEKRLERKRTSETAIHLAREIEEGAMAAMLPSVEPGERERMVPCPEMGQGTVGVTAPEALSIAAYLRKNCSPAEQERICEMAEENARALASSGDADSQEPLLPCPLQGDDHVCCVYAARPLRCRVLHAITIATEAHSRREPVDRPDAGMPAESGHEATVAQGIETGVTQALESAGLDGRVYELNNALATALKTPDAAERWAKGETVFQRPMV